MIRSAVDGKTRAIRAQHILGVHPKVGVFYGQSVHYDATENGGAAR